MSRGKYKYRQEDVGTPKLVSVKQDIIQHTPRFKGTAPFKKVAQILHKC